MSRGFPAAAKEALQDAQLRRNVGKATTAIRAKRARAVGELPDWEALRDAGAAIKARAMATLPEQLERLETSVTRAEVCTAVDTSCLMHIGGALTRQRAGVRVMHIAEILAAQE